MSVLQPLLSLSVLLCVLSCQPAAPPSSTEGQSAPAAGRFEAHDQANLTAIRGALLTPAQLPHFMWRQSLRITAQGKTHQLEAIVQNDGQEFFVLGLGPGGMKLFLVTHTGQSVTSRVFISQRMSLSPEYLLFDIQRALFWPPVPCGAGSYQGFAVSDRCKDLRTVSRKVSDGPLGSPQSSTHLDINYPHGFTFKGPPDVLSLRHAARGYQIDITQLESHVLP